MTMLEHFVRRMYPDATVQRCAFEDAYRVTIVVTEREVAKSRVEPEAFCRRVAQKLTPRRIRRRRLHWGMRK